MDIRWLKGCKTNAEKEERKRTVLSYRNSFEDLTEIMETMRRKPANRDYSSPGWQYQQIAANEFNAALDEIIKLITVSK